MLTAFRSKDGFGGFGFHGLTFLGLGGVTPTRVFLKKRLQAVENKGNGVLEARKEALSDWKQRGNGNMEVDRRGEFRCRSREFTAQVSMVDLLCQYIFI